MQKKYFIVSILILSIAFALAFLMRVPNTNVVLSQSKETLPNNSNRDLSLYEQGKTYDFSWSKLKTLRAEREEFREYLWQQWSKQRRTTVTATFYSVEGDPTTSTYYIEPDESGRWHIAVESECCWTYAMLKPKKQRERRKYSATYSDLERVQEVQDKNGLFLKWKEVPTDKQLAPQNYMLRLKKGDEKSPNVF
ncbi:MAG: hypothetical protein LC768_05930 [Acidobacteria bacterium]|nr:hypothetical protein [Acidobacteriota bacterium]MCA1637862.1 hypothetical protein [Acidobacteriota bacterium]